MTPKSFVAALAESQMPSVFNPWRDCCPVHDRSDAPLRRRRNLERVLAAAIEARVETIWIARDLGYRGGRRTGIPLTDEVHLDRAGVLLGGVSLERATQGPVVAERTAAIIWNVLARIDQPVVLWNVFPFHPHEASNPFSNRCHSRTERETTWPILQGLIEMIRPRQIMAIGRDAHVALGDVGVPTSSVRHPSYGGQTEFISGVFSIYGVDPLEKPGTPQLPFAGD